MSDNQIKDILKNSKTIAIIGISSEKKGEDRKNLKRKPANVVMKYMQDFGYKVYPINPFAKGEVINGEKVYESLEEIQKAIVRFPMVDQCNCNFIVDTNSGGYKVYVRYKSKRVINEVKLTNFLRKRLELFKIPSKFTRIR